jgi:hypothetical protein
VGLHRTPLSEEEAMEAMRPLDEEELRYWYNSSFEPDRDKRDED